MDQEAIRVLWFDDGSPQDRTIAQILLSSGEPRFEVETARESARGLQRLTAGKFDLILLDLSVADDQGFDAVGSHRRQGRGVTRRLRAKLAARHNPADNHYPLSFALGEELYDSRRPCPVEVRFARAEICISEQKPKQQSSRADARGGTSS